MNTKRYVHDLEQGNVALAWDTVKRRMVVTDAEFYGIEFPIHWGLLWDGKAWKGRYSKDGQLWYGTTPHGFFPETADDYAQAVHVAQVIARRFNWDRDGRGRYSGLAKDVESLTLVAL